ncbi:MAG: hypothetical protein IT363_02235 [Methanoregulaceae archaeon]|nr:hypothetical protein [Methanoregulaceae archaeon]
MLVNLTPGQKVSGSGVEFGLRLKMLPSANYGVQPEITGIFAQSVKISMNGTLGELLNEQGEWDTEMDFQPMFRFTSTVFNHLQTIQINVEIEYVLESSTTVYPLTYEHTYTVTAHNVLQNLGNSMNNAVPPAYDALFEADANATTSAADNKLKPAHIVIPGATAMSETKETILERLLQATVFCASTHGSATKLSDSDSSEFVFFEEMALRVAAKPAAGTPKLNLVALWACAAGSDPAANYLGVGDSAINRALVGFTQDVSIHVWTQEEYSEWEDTEAPTLPSKKLSDHAALFWTRLKLGDTVMEALAACDATYATVPSSWVPPSSSEELIPPPPEAKMVCFGDALTRLFYVYLTLTQRQANINPIKNWVRLDVPLEEQ